MKKLKIVAGKVEIRNRFCPIRNRLNKTDRIRRCNLESETDQRHPRRNSLEKEREMKTPIWKMARASMSSKKIFGDLLVKIEEA